MARKQALETQRGSASASPIFVEAEKLFEQMKEFSQEVAQRAYSFFEGRGSEPGHDLEDWFQAESELLRRVPVETSETDAEFKVRAEAPGFSADEIKVSVEPCCLMISGKTEALTESSAENPSFSEQRASMFCHTLDLPSEVDPAQAQATLSEGILELTLPKAPKAAQASIEVKAV